MKQLCHIAIIMLTACVLYSCMKDDTTTVSTSEDTAITTFTLGTVKVNRYIGKKKYAKDKEGNPIDSFYTYSYTGSKTPIYIDHLGYEDNERIGLIYNVDSLPAGSHMKMLASVSAKNSSTIRYRDWDADEKATWTNYVSGDSIVFGTDNVGSKTLRFRVFASQGGYTRDYKVKIVAHMEYADSFKYVQLASQEIFDEVKSLRGASTSDGLYVLASDGTESYLYLGTKLGSEWEKVTIAYKKEGSETNTEVDNLGSDASIAGYEEKIYVLDGNSLYFGDVTHWNKVDVAGYNLEFIVGACKDELYAINHDGNFMVANRENLSSWREDEVYSHADKIPVADVHSATVVQKAYEDVSRITVVGNISVAGTDTCAVVWNKNVSPEAEEKWVYNDCTDAKQKNCALPAMENLSATGYYKGWILAIGGKGLNTTTKIETPPYGTIFCSEDGGTSWRTLKGLKMPIKGLDGSKPVMILSDIGGYSYDNDLGYFYIISADGGDVYRCKLNNATWYPTDTKEYSVLEQ